MNRYLIPSIIGILCLFITTAATSQETGIASYYHDGLTGLRMANGQRYNPDLLICAHPTLPLGSIVKVARKDCPDQSVMVTVVDRGPFVKGRIIDLSKRAAREIDLLHLGITEVIIALVKRPDVTGVAMK